MIQTDEIAEAIQRAGLGRIEGRLPASFSGTTLDSRRVEPGQLFVALPGERTNGARYVGDAIARGAAAAMVEAASRALVDVDCPLIVVEDGTLALQEIARVHRERRSALVVGVTGSVGKTTTKELAAAVLSACGPVLKNEKNFNNELGLPLTLLSLDQQHRYAVLEMGMDGPGQIRRLAEIAGPTIGVVTNVGPVHLERLGSMDNIQAAKAELVESLDSSGVAVLNADDERVRTMADRTRARVITYGRSEAADVRVSEIEEHGFHGIRFQLRWNGSTQPVALHCLGAHNALNAAAAAAVGVSQGLALDQVATALETFSNPLRLVPIAGKGGVTILDDTYNASPASVIAALDTLAKLDGRKIAVLGDMKELGAYELEGHRSVGRRAAETVDLLVTVGALGEEIARAARDAGLDCVHPTASNAEARAVLEGMLSGGDIVLVKGSHSMHLEEIVSELRA